MNGITLVFAFGGTFQGHPFFYNIFTMGLAPGAMLATVEGNQVYVNNAGFTTIDDLDTFKNMIKPQLLPEVTASDNDKILKVVNGAWAASALDKSSFVVNFTLSEDKTTATADKTTAEISNASENGQIVVGLLTGDFITYILPFNGITIGGPSFSTVMNLRDIVQTITLAYNDITNNYDVIDEKIESFTDTEIETFYNANA